jgi:serine/threonine-protein phosphatase 2A regulatory subunit A
LSTLILPLFKALTADDQDSVRLLAIESSAAIAKLLSHDENTQHVLPIVRASVEDRSWRVRFSIAKDFYPVRGFFVISLPLSRSHPWDMMTR